MLIKLATGCAIWYFASRTNRSDSASAGSARRCEPADCPGLGRRCLALHLKTETLRLEVLNTARQCALCEQAWRHYQSCRVSHHVIASEAAAASEPHGDCVRAESPW